MIQEFLKKLVVKQKKTTQGKTPSLKPKTPGVKPLRLEIYSDDQFKFIFKFTNIIIV